MFDRNLAHRMIAAATRRVTRLQDELSRLDSVAGDGDHGVNMATALAEAVRRGEQHRHQTAGDVFRVAGKAFHDTVGGAAGALFGAFFGVLGARLNRVEAPDAADFVLGLQDGLARVMRIGRSGPGQKTMIDALAPATDRAVESLEAGADLTGVVVAAAQGAREGAASTAAMRPAAGRARYAPDAGVGFEDPGACTVALMLEAWADEVAESSA